MPESVILTQERILQNLTLDHYYPWEGKSPVMRCASLSDMDRIMEIENTCFPGHLAYTRKHMYYLIFRARSITFVEECGETVRGYVNVLFRKGSNTAGIESIGVDPYYRGQGVGKRLLSRVEEEMASRGVHYSTLEVSAGNSAALSMYEKAGYKVVRSVKDYYRYEHHGTHTAYGMIKVLRPQDTLK